MPQLAAYRPAAVNLDGVTVTVDDWTAGCTDAQGTDWSLTTLDGWWGTPQRRVGLAARQFDHGSFDAPAFLEPRTLTVEGVAVSTSRAAHLLARDIVACVAGLDAAVLYPLVVSESGYLDRQCMVRQSGEVKVADVTDTVCRWSMVLVAPDPRRYAADEMVVTLTLPVGAGVGLIPPVTPPFSIPSGSATNRATVVNDGTFPTRPTVVFTGPVTNPAVANLTTSRTLAFDLTVASGESLVVDFDARSVLLNGEVSRAYAITPGSAWFDLQPGANDVQYAAAAGTGTAVLTYRSAWL